MGCKDDANNSVNKSTSISDGHTKMVEELSAIANDKSNVNVWHLNEDRAKFIDQQLSQVNEPSQKVQMMYKSGIEWLNAGKYEVAIKRLKGLIAYIKDNNFRLPPQVDNSIYEVLGIAYLRKAEIENCIKHHNEYSCLLPIEGKGQHIERDGGEAALEVFSELLKTNPTPQTTWLYNVTQMTLGGYPDQIDRKNLLPPFIFESDVKFPRFTEMGTSLGVGVNDISGGVILEDFNGDGYLDIVASSYGLDDQIKYFENDTHGGFQDKTSSSGLMGILSGLNLIQADYDNDGDIDFLILRGAWLAGDGKHPNSLIRNDGNSHFTDVTHEAGLYSKFPTQTATWADFNNDGFVDLFIGNEHSPVNPATSQLYYNNQDGTFSDVATEKNAAINAFIKGCVSRDYDNDGDMDIYLSVINGNNILLQNQGSSNGFVFENRAGEAGVLGPVASFPCWFFDYDQDGYEDIFVSGFDFKDFETAAGEVAKGYMDQKVDAQLPALYMNNGNGTFSEVSEQANVDEVLYTMGCNYGDLNNDGYPDFYAATGTPDFRALIPNRMFLNDRNGGFYDVTKAGAFGHLQKGHAVAFGDIDNDGDQDIYTVLGGSYDGDNFMNALFVNPGMGNNHLRIRLIGTKSNRSAIGSKVKITAEDSDGSEKIFYNTVSSGGSFGANPLRIEQGLGNCNNIRNIEITWAGSNNKQSIKNVGINTYIIIEEGNNDSTTKPLTPVKLQPGKHHHHHH